MKGWQIVQDVMTAEQIKAKMISEADVKLRSTLSDVDPFWIRWSFWLEELDKKERAALDKDREIEALKGTINSLAKHISTIIPDRDSL